MRAGPGARYRDPPVGLEALLAVVVVLSIVGLLIVDNVKYALLA